MATALAANLTSFLLPSPAIAADTTPPSTNSTKSNSTQPNSTQANSSPAASPPHQAQSQQEPLNPAQDWPSLNSLLKLPAWVNLGLNIQSAFLGNPGGGIKRTTNWIQQTTLDAIFSRGFGKDVTLWKEADHWQGHVELMLFSGKAGYGQSIGNAFPLTASDHPTGLWLTEASITRYAGKGEVDVKAGVFSLNPGFIEAPVLDAYVNSVFNNTLNINTTGYAINPYVATGIELRWRPATAGKGNTGDLGPYGELRYGAYQLDSQYALASLFGVNPDQAQINGSMQVLQWSFDRLPGAKKLSQPIQLEQQAIARQLPPPLLQVGGGYLNNRTTHKVTPGFASTLTMAVPTPLGIDNRMWLGLSVIGKNDNNPYPVFVSAGWLSQGVIPSRPLDVLALGYGRSSFNNELYPNYTQETSIELNYNYVLNSTLSAQPFVQWMLNPAGNSSVKNIWALGIQLQLQF